MVSYTSTPLHIYYSVLLNEISTETTLPLFLHCKRGFDVQTVPLLCNGLELDYVFSFDNIVLRGMRRGLIRRQNVRGTAYRM
jgi:hypothetical protein